MSRSGESEPKGAPLNPSRRQLLGWAGLVGGGALLPNAASAAPQAAAPAAMSAAEAAIRGQNVYKAIGVRPFINCRGTLTVLGGNIELPEVRAAKSLANQQHAQLDEVMAAVGKRLAELTGAEWGMVSAGCSAAMSHATAACVAGGNPDLHVRMPNLDGLPEGRGHHPRPLAQRVRRGHPRRRREDRRGRHARGARARDRSEDRDDLHHGRPTQRNRSDVHRGDLRDRQDAQRPGARRCRGGDSDDPEHPPAARRDARRYSGGKFIRGPQSAGLLLGRKDLCQAAWVHSAPHHGYSRAMKVGREEMVGMLVAVESWVKRDHDAEWKQWIARCQHIADRVSKIPGVTATVRSEPGGRSNRSPNVSIRWDSKQLGLTGQDVAQILDTTEPRILLGGGGGGGGQQGQQQQAGDTGVSMVPSTMAPGDERVVANRLYEILTAKHTLKPVATPAPPAAELSGIWDVEIPYAASKTMHTLQLLQNGPRVTGNHQGNFQSRDISGTVAGDGVTLASNVTERHGDSLNYRFTGKATGDTMSGTLDLGEYLAATWTAKRRGRPA